MEGNFITGGQQDSRTFCKRLYKRKVLDLFCFFSLFVHSRLKFLHSIKSHRQGEFGKQLGEVPPNVATVHIHSTALSCWSVTEELFGKKMLKSWVTFFLITFNIISENMLPWEEDFMWERGREVRERDEGVRKRLVRLTACKQREALSKLERSKIWHKLTGRKKRAGDNESTGSSFALELSYYMYFLLPLKELIMWFSSFWTNPFLYCSLWQTIAWVRNSRSMIISKLYSTCSNIMLIIGW